MKRLLLSAAASTLLMASAAVAAEPARTTLPIPRAPVGGVIAETAEQSRPGVLTGEVRAPQGAPNIFLMMSDDVGFAMSSGFGGPVPTPNMDRLAASGQRYDRFHTTAICSPSRAALLTGRNHHRVGTGILSDAPDPYPGYDARLPPSAATIAETLRLNGYSTAMFGKHHNVPGGDGSPAGPFDMWPTGLGFEYYFGFLGGDADQWSPVLYRGTDQLPEHAGPPELLDHRLASDAIRWVHNQNAAAPDKPFFIYFAPGSTHAPHQAPAEDIARFKGKFDQGWDRMREEIFKRQLALGIVPKGTKLTPRPDAIPAWNSLTPDQKAFAARSMEVAAAMLAYQDAQLGRLFDELERMGLADRTLFVVVQGDNGASAEVGPRGSINEIGHMANNVEEDDAWLTANIDKLGGPDTYGSYPAGWAWAMDTPFRWTKQYASMLGGVRNAMTISWKGHVAQPGAVCAEFGHLVDIAPTLLEAARLPAPKSVNGVEQMAFDGQSLLPSLTSCTPDKPRTQYFEMYGKVGLYKDGWFLSGDNGRLPWQNTPPPGFDAAQIPWALYDLRKDFSQSEDIAAKNPEVLADMIATWRTVAADNKVFPLDHRFARARLSSGGPPPPTRHDYWGGDVSIPARRGPVFTGRSFTLDAEVELAKAEASGVIFAEGSRFAGFSLYLDKGRPSFAYALSTRPQDTTKITAAAPLPAGPARLRLVFAAEGLGKGAKVQLLNGDAVVATGAVPRTFFIAAGVGERMDVGQDTGVTVTDYATPQGKLQGDVRHVAVTFP